MSGMKTSASAESEGTDPDWEYAPLRIPADVGRLSAAAQLSLHAEFGGWELARVQRYHDGTRRVVLPAAADPRPPCHFPSFRSDRRNHRGPAGQYEV